MRISATSYPGAGTTSFEASLAASALSVAHSSTVCSTAATGARARATAASTAFDASRTRTAVLLNAAFARALAAVAPFCSA
eukprot:574968-Prymnesium_polylepis.2